MLFGFEISRWVKFIGRGKTVPKVPQPYTRESSSAAWFLTNVSKTYIYNKSGIYRYEEILPRVDHVKESFYICPHPHKHQCFFFLPEKISGRENGFWYFFWVFLGRKFFLAHFCIFIFLGHILVFFLGKKFKNFLGQIILAGVKFLTGWIPFHGYFFAKFQRVQNFCYRRNFANMSRVSARGKCHG